MRWEESHADLGEKADEVSISQRSRFWGKCWRKTWLTHGRFLLIGVLFSHPYSSTWIKPHTKHLQPAWLLSLFLHESGEHIKSHFSLPQQISEVRWYPLAKLYCSSPLQLCRDRKSHIAKSTQVIRIQAVTILQLVFHWTRTEGLHKHIYFHIFAVNYFQNSSQELNFFWEVCKLQFFYHI